MKELNLLLEEKYNELEELDIATNMLYDFIWHQSGIYFKEKSFSSLDIIKFKEKLNILFCGYILKTNNVVPSLDGIEGKIWEYAREIQLIYSTNVKYKGTNDFYLFQLDKLLKQLNIFKEFIIKETENDTNKDI